MSIIIQRGTALFRWRKITNGVLPLGLHATPRSPLWMLWRALRSTAFTWRTIF